MFTGCGMAVENRTLLAPPSLAQEAPACSEINEILFTPSRCGVNLRLAQIESSTRQTLDEYTLDRAVKRSQVGGHTYQKLANAINTFRVWRVRGGTSEVVSRVRSVKISRSYKSGKKAGELLCCCTWLYVLSTANRAC